MADTLTWPSITAPAYGTTEDVEDTSLRSTFEDGTTQARRKFTKSRKTWVLKWDSLPYKEYNTLMDFLQNKTYFRRNLLFSNPRLMRRRIPAASLKKRRLKRLP